jgi:hypothetical protein
MRKTLLIAAAALAGSIISSQAQVYSQNIVGYANVTLNSGYTLVASQFNSGASNGLNEVAANLPYGSTVLLFNGVGYNQYQYAPGLNDANTIFIDPDSQNDVTTPVVQPGQGFFVQNPGTAVTNTFVGTVATNVINLAAGYSLVGSPLPYGGDITNSLINLNLVTGATILIYNGTGYSQYQYAPGFNDAGTVFIDPDTQNDKPDPILSVGQGFFYQNPGSAVTWAQVYP